jgi:hypothetical protein
MTRNSTGTVSTRVLYLVGLEPVLVVVLPGAGEGTNGDRTSPSVVLSRGASPRVCG